MEDQDDPTAALCARLRRYDTPTVSNAIESFGVRDRTDGYASSAIRCEFPDLGPLVGYAVTCTIDSTTGGPQRPTRLLDLIDTLARAGSPSVIVCQYVGSDRERGCFLGDMSAALYRRLGAVGVITDMPNRDLPSIQRRAPGFHVFGAGTVASHGNGAVIDVGTPVVVAGLRVRPGDLVHADANGVISIPLAIASEIAEAAERVWENEQTVFDKILDPASPLEEIKRAFTH
jgi:regulator of RNase E activity RraA